MLVYVRLFYKKMVSLIFQHFLKSSDVPAQIDLRWTQIDIGEIKILDSKPEAYLRPSPTSIMELFTKIVISYE